MFLFTYYQSSPTFCNHQIVITITVTSPERSYIEYTRMPSPVYQYVINLAVGLPISRGSGVYMSVRSENIVFLTTRMFDVAKFNILTPLSLLPCRRLPFPIVGFKISSLPSFALKSRNRIFIWYFGKWSNTCSTSSYEGVLISP